MENGKREKKVKLHRGQQLVGTDVDFAFVVVLAQARSPPTMAPIRMAPLRSTAVCGRLGFAVGDTFVTTYITQRDGESKGTDEWRSLATQDATGWTLSLVRI